MNYREKMREQINKYPYGEYYGLKPNQPKDIIRLLNEMDNADEYIKKIFFEKENLQSKIDKAIEFVESMEYCGQEDYFYDNKSNDPCGNDNTFNDSKNKLLSILKENK